MYFGRNNDLINSFWNLNYPPVHHQSRQSPQIRHLRTQLKNKHKFKILWYHYFRYANYIGLKSFRRMGRYTVERGIVQKLCQRYFADFDISTKMGQFSGLPECIWTLWGHSFHSVLEYIWIKGSYPDQILPQHVSLYPVGLISARIKILHIGNFFTK